MLAKTIWAGHMVRVCEGKYNFWMKRCLLFVKLNWWCRGGGMSWPFGGHNLFSFACWTVRTGRVVWGVGRVGGILGSKIFSFANLNWSAHWGFQRMLFLHSGLKNGFSTCWITEMLWQCLFYNSVWYMKWCEIFVESNCSSMQYWISSVSLCL